MASIITLILMVFIPMVAFKVTRQLIKKARYVRNLLKGVIVPYIEQMSAADDIYADGDEESGSKYSRKPSVILTKEQIDIIKKGFITEIPKIPKMKNTTPKTKRRLLITAISIGSLAAVFTATKVIMDLVHNLQMVYF